ncbi:hypothetical protein PsYK624_153530 [Phanerochaete sordida]|uniref:Uncharacterized protein n=1 Tax=Phanerochaete sordida TaxID=48140 RepID=A0A9P3GP36_9APHY|nr:hypothetical protein PsYK624_153530 [Phanerochaete sordida]
MKKYTRGGAKAQAASAFGDVDIVLVFVDFALRVASRSCLGRAAVAIRQQSYISGPLQRPFDALNQERAAGVPGHSMVSRTGRTCLIYAASSSCLVALARTDLRNTPGIRSAVDIRLCKGSSAIITQALTSQLRSNSVSSVSSSRETLKTVTRFGILSPMLCCRTETLSAATSNSSTPASVGFSSRKKRTPSRLPRAVPQKLASGRAIFLHGSSIPQARRRPARLTAASMCTRRAGCRQCMRDLLGARGGERRHEEPAVAAS